MNKRKKYSAQLKFQIAQQALNKIRPIQELSREFDINSNLIAKWRDKLQNEGYKVFETQTPKNNPRKKIEQLETIIGKKEVEVQLLKKYLGFYAQGWPNE